MREPPVASIGSTTRQVRFSISAAIQFLREAGVKDIRCLTIVSCPEGVKATLDFDPEVRLYTCTVDRQLSPNAYILPGLGDAGDRIYGTK